MTSPIRFTALVALAFGIACGGRIDSQSGAPAEPTPDPADTSEGTPTNAASEWGTTALGPCVLGFDPEEEPNLPCEWLAGDRCYASKLEACACICPRNSRHSVCSSGFPQGPGITTRVSCD